MGTPSRVEITVLMPCLNEAETIGVCVDKAISFLRSHELSGEVLIADNGSTDGSQAIATSGGARVIAIPVRGYGAALQGGIADARGDFTIMGDADDSYDFMNLMPFIGALRGGADLVMGNRFRGGIGAGSMPFLHRYLGNPVLSFIGRLFFRLGVGDFHCGLRGFRTQRIRDLHLKAMGMEFASEMVVRASLAKLAITEVPTTLKKDGRSRPPHLRTWRDGWRHLRFLLMFSPRWLFFYPGVFLIGIGLLLSLVLLPGPFALTPLISLDIHSLVVGAMAILLGSQCVSFAAISRRYAAARGFLPFSANVQRFLSPITLERVLLTALPVGLLGLIGIAWCVLTWASVGFGPLQYGSLIRLLIVSMTAICVALQVALTAFLAEILEIE